MQDFGCDSYIRIHDPAEFGHLCASHKHIPGFRVGGEGPCMYQHLRLVEHAEQSESAASTSDKARKSELAALIQQYALFLKHKA